MAALPMGMQLISALDDANFTEISPVHDMSLLSSDNVQYTLLLPLQSDDKVLDVEMDIDLDVFRPSAMSDIDPLSNDWDEFYFGSLFQPDLGDVKEDIEQMLLCESEELALHSSHQHETAPGQECQCRNFAIRANRVQAQQERVIEALAAKDQKRVLRHTFGSGKRLVGFGFGEKKTLRDQSQQENIETTDSLLLPALHFDEVIAAEHDGEVVDKTLTSSKSFVAIKQEIPTTPERVLLTARVMGDDQIFNSPLRRKQVVSAVSSPLSTTSFVSIESMMTTPLSATSRSTVYPEISMMRSLSPADELEKMASSSSKSSVPKMSMLRGNFQVSPGRDTVPLVNPTAVLPPPYFRGALDSPEKRRAYSKTVKSFAQSLSFSFASNSSMDR